MSLTNPAAPREDTGIHDATAYAARLELRVRHLEQAVARLEQQLREALARPSQDRGAS